MYIFYPLGAIATSKTENAQILNGEKSLVVFPFRNLGSNEENQYNIDGIVDF